ncbi:MAG: hypothetical protein QOH86_1997 [Sphingomonadales bacterium]|nr:hypothetical protein [Sphingomonadales bacterium]
MSRAIAASPSGSSQACSSTASATFAASAARSGAVTRGSRSTVRLKLAQTADEGGAGTEPGAFDPDPDPEVGAWTALWLMKRYNRRRGLG